MKKLRFLKNVLFFTSLLFTVIACKEDMPENEVASDSIAKIAQQNSELSTLVTALTAADLVGTLDGMGNFTVFAPTNAAFSKLDPNLLNSILADKAKLTKLLQYHVLNSRVSSGQLTNGNVITLEGSSISVNLSSGVVLNGSARVTNPDINASNGIIHLIDEVLIPENFGIQTIAEIATSNPNFSILAGILSRPENADLLAAASSSTATLTVFAPTNEAFTNLLGTLSGLGVTSLDDLPASLLKEIVQYHLVGSKVLSGSLAAGNVNTLLQGEVLTVSLSGGVKVNSATVINADIEATNGVIHVIDQVLLPSFLTNSLGKISQDIVLKKQYSILAAALKKADLLNVVSSTDNLTIFAPTDQAFASSGITSLDGLSAADLTPILLYHVLGQKVRSSQLPASGIAQTLAGNSIYLGYLGSGGVLINGKAKVTSVDNERGTGVIHTIDHVIIPPAPDVVDVASYFASASTPEFTVLVSLLTNASYKPVLDALKAAENVTVFAPTDAAFGAIANVIPTLSTAQISNILTYHVLGARVFSSQLSNGQQATTLNGQNITVNIGNQVTIKDQSGGADARVTETNIHARNGVIHVIDKVLLPAL